MDDVTKIDDNTLGIPQPPITYTKDEIDGRVRASQQRVLSRQSRLEVAQNELAKWIALQEKSVELGLQSTQQ